MRCCAVALGNKEMVFLSLEHHILKVCRQAHQLYHRYLERKSEKKKSLLYFCILADSEYTLKIMYLMFFKTIEPLHCFNLDHDYDHIHILFVIYIVWQI